MQIRIFGTQTGAFDHSVACIGTQYEPQPMSALAVQASIISEQAVVEHILCRYALTDPVRCEFYKLGVNDTYRVLSADRLFFLRIYTPRYSDPGAIQREINLLLALEPSKLSVGAPVADRDGEYTQAICAPEGQRYAVLFRGGKGRSIDVRDMAQVRAFGAWAGAFHNATDSLDLPGVRGPMNTQRMVYRNLKQFLPRLAKRPLDAAFAEQLADQLATRLAALPLDTNDIGITHGDLHHGNSIYQAENGVLTFDFADSAVGWRLYDLGVFLFAIRTSIPQKQQRVRIWNQFIRGYRAQRAIKREQLEQVLLFTALKQFWLLGFHSTMGDRHGTGWLNDRYYDAAFQRLREAAKDLNIMTVEEYPMPDRQ